MSLGTVVLSYRPRVYDFQAQDVYAPRIRPLDFKVPEVKKIFPKFFDCFFYFLILFFKNVFQTKAFFRSKTFFKQKVLL